MLKKLGKQFIQKETGWQNKHAMSVF